MLSLDFIPPEMHSSIQAIVENHKANFNETLVKIGYKKDFIHIDGHLTYKDLLCLKAVLEFVQDQKVP